jgi:hypothetical protein
MPATFNHCAGRFDCGIYDVVAGYFRRFGIVAGIAVATGCIMFARYIYAG